MTTLDTTLPVHGAQRAHPSLRVLVRSASHGFGALIIRLLEWQERARRRRQLLSLSDGALKDFGASRADAEGEGRKPRWQP
jgi:uncharacterized protein YjiS (DUF1127 family)